MASRMDYRDGVLVSALADNGDGTGTFTTYDAEGQVASTEALTGLPIDAPIADLSAEITAAKASLAAATTISQVRARTIALFDLLNTEA